MSLLVAVACYLLQRRGISTSPDGTVYTGVASNLSRGRGLSVPFTIYTDHYTPLRSVEFNHRVPLRQWPPLYPAVLSVLVRLGASAETAARILNPALLGVNVFLCGVFTRRVFRSSWALLFPSVLALVLIRDPTPVSSSLLYLHVTTLAEPLFLLLVLVTLLLLDRFLETRSFSWLLAAAATASLANLTKVLGISVIAVVCLVAVLCAGSSLVRLGRATTCAAIGILPSVPTLLSASSSDSPPTWSQFTGVRAELRDGLVELAPPGTGPDWVRWIVVAIVVAGSLMLALLAYRRPNGPRHLIALAPPAALAACLVAQLVFSRTFVDRYVSLVGRQLSVVQLLIAIIVVGLVSMSGDRPQVHKRAVATLAAAAILTIATAGLPLVRAVADPPYFKHSLAMSRRTVAAANTARDLFSNAPDYLYASTGTASYLVPCRTDYYSGTPRPEFADEMDQLGELVRTGRATVLLVGGRLGVSADCASASDFDGRPGITTRQVDPDTAVISATP